MNYFLGKHEPPQVHASCQAVPGFRPGTIIGLFNHDRGLDQIC